MKALEKKVEKVLVVLFQGFFLGHIGNSHGFHGTLDPRCTFSVDSSR